jgi:hypothetical protein
MRRETYALAMPEDLMAEVRRTAQETGLSLAEAMRQAMKFGLPKLRDNLSGPLRPFTEAECQECWGKPDPEWDALEHHMAGLPVPRVEDE